MFGTCSQDDVPSSFTYTLTENDLKKLEIEILKLVKYEFSWKDGYTQCIIQNVIISLSIREPFSKRICSDLIFEFNGPMEDDIQSIFSQLVDRSGLIEAPRPADEYKLDVFAPSQKRDEIVRVHKYYDKNKKLHKRQFYEPNLDYSSYLPFLPGNNIDSLNPGYFGRNFNSQQDQLAEFENTGIPYDDLLLVKNYLEEERQRELYKSKLSELFSEILDGSQQLNDNEITDTPILELDEQENPGYSWSGPEEFYGLTQPGIHSS